MKIELTNSQLIKKMAETPKEGFEIKFFLYVGNKGKGSEKYFVLSVSDSDVDYKWIEAKIDTTFIIKKKMASIGNIIAVYANDNTVSLTTTYFVGTWPDKEEVDYWRSQTLDFEIASKAKMQLKEGSFDDTIKYSMRPIKDIFKYASPVAKQAIIAKIILYLNNK